MKRLCRRLLALSHGVQFLELTSSADQSRGMLRRHHTARRDGELAALAQEMGRTRSLALERRLGHHHTRRRRLERRSKRRTRGRVLRWSRRRGRQ